MARLNKNEGIRMRKEGHSIAEIAAQLGGSVSGWNQFFRREGMTEKQTSHKEWLPWTMTQEQHKSYAATLIRHLSHLAKGNKLSEYDEEHLWLANTAIKWANELIDEGKDYDYDPEVGPSDFCKAGGLYLREPESKNKWRLRRLMREVVKTQTRKSFNG